MFRVADSPTGCQCCANPTAPSPTLPAGRPTKLVSQFHLTYSMILNLLRIQQLRIQDIMKSSFAETGTQKNRADNERRLARFVRRTEGRKRCYGVLALMTGMVETRALKCGLYRSGASSCKTVIAHDKAARVYTNMFNPFQLTALISQLHGLVASKLK